jgi:hypothetical protein
MIPSGYKDQKVYSVKPTDGTGDLTFSRASSATRVASNGLIEKVRTNLALQSQTFDNASWTKYQSSVTANSTTAPDGTLTADTLADTAANDSHQLEQNIVFPASEATISIFAKANTLSHIKITAYDGAAFRDSGIFNLSNGTVSGVGSIINVGNGWYRCSYTFSSTGGAGVSYVFTSNGSSTVYAGSGQSVYIWGYQLETGVLTDYIATTTAAVSVGPVSGLPRLDYLGSTCPKLLLEPQRTNLALYSEQFNNAAWVNDQITISANTTISPDGYQNADTATIVTSGSNLVTQVISVSASTTYTFSFYVKRGTATDLRYSIYDVTNAANIVAPTTYYSQTSSSQWVRISFTFATPVGCLSIACYPIRNATSTGTAFLYGCQLEAGAYATSYIPTLGATVTRVADAASKTSISSLIGQTEGTIFVDFTLNGLADYGTPISVNDGSTTNYIWLTIFANGTLRAELYNGTAQASISFAGAVVGSRYKMAFGYKTNDFAFYVNGALVGTDLTGTTFSGTTLSRVDTNLTNASLYSLASESINQQLLFKTRLTNAQLAELTA